MLSRWEFSKVFSEEVASFELNLEVRAKCGQGLLAGVGGDRAVKIVQALQVAMAGISVNHMTWLIFLLVLPIINQFQMSQCTTSQVSGDGKTQVAERKQAELQRLSVAGKLCTNFNLLI